MKSKNYPGDNNNEKNKVENIIKQLEKQMQMRKQQNGNQQENKNDFRNFDFNENQRKQEKKIYKSSNFPTSEQIIEDNIDIEIHLSPCVQKQQQQMKLLMKKKEKDFDVTQRTDLKIVQCNYEQLTHFLRMNHVLIPAKIQNDQIVQFQQSEQKG